MSVKQVTVNPPRTDGGMGKSNTANLAAAFNASPILNGDDPLVDDGSADAPLLAHYRTLALDGIVNDGGHTYGEFNRDYAENGAPSYGEVETGGGGLPASPWVPNPASPAPDGYGEDPPEQWGTGVGSQLSPQESSAQIASQKLGDYVMGRANQS
jgi:hypothetical protein